MSQHAETKLDHPARCQVFLRFAKEQFDAQKAEGAE